MSYALQDAVWEIKDLKAADKIVLLRLAHHARDASDPAFPSQAALAEYTGLCVRAVRSALRELEKKGLIKAVGSAGKDNYKYAKRWLLIFENRQEMPETKRQDMPDMTEKRQEMPDQKRQDMPDPEQKRQDMPVKAAPYADEPIKEPVKETPVVSSACAWGQDREVPAAWIEEGNAIREKAGLHPINVKLEAQRFALWFGEGKGKDSTTTDWHASWKRWVWKSNQTPFQAEMSTKPAYIRNQMYDHTTVYRAPRSKNQKGYVTPPEHMM